VAKWRAMRASRFDSTWNRILLIEDEDAVRDAVNNSFDAHRSRGDGAPSCRDGERSFREWETPLTARRSILPVSLSRRAREAEIPRLRVCLGSRQGCLDLRQIRLFPTPSPRASSWHIGCAQAATSDV
jgi:hypothetical protein